jgi:glycosyltransferase involved in cell wall biosynthesis
MYHYPLIYHSLELFIEDNPVIHRVYHLRDAEKKYHKLAAATIVQDELRADVLLKSNGIDQRNVLYFPVSVKGNLIREKSKYLQNKFNIGDDKKILLYFGSFDKTRCTTQMVRMARNLDDDVILVVHGWGSKRYLDYLQAIADKKKVIFSLDFLAEDEIASMVSSSHIGIALYDTKNFNDRLVAFSSNKVAYYAQCGVPLIAFDTESFRELVNSYQCVELITHINETPQKVRKILENYDLYQQQSYSAYQRFYDLDENFSKLISNLEIIIYGLQSVNDNDIRSSM